MQKITEKEAGVLEKAAAEFIQFKAKAFLKKEEKTDANNFIIRSPKASLVLFSIFTFISAFIVVFLAAASLINAFTTLIVEIVFSFCFLLFLYFLISMIRFKIIINNNQITSLFRLSKKKSFTFDYITTVKFTIMTHRNYIDGALENILIEAYHEEEILFSLTPDSPGCNLLISRLKDRGIAFIYGYR